MGKSESEALGIWVMRACSPGERMRAQALPEEARRDFHQRLGRACAAAVGRGLLHAETEAAANKRPANKGEGE